MVKSSEKATAAALAILLAIVAISTLIIMYEPHSEGKEVEAKNMGVTEKNAPSAVINRCIGICKDVSNLVDFRNGHCLSPDLNGFGCAIIKNNSGHCARFYRGTPEIVLDENCSYVGVIQWKG